MGVSYSLTCTSTTAPTQTAHTGNGEMSSVLFVRGATTHNWQNDCTPVTTAVMLDTSGLVRAPPNQHL